MNLLAADTASSLCVCACLCGYCFTFTSLQLNWAGRQLSTQKTKIAPAGWHDMALISCPAPDFFVCLLCFFFSSTASEREHLCKSNENQDSQKYIELFLNDYKCRPTTVSLAECLQLQVFIPVGSDVFLFFFFFLIKRIIQSRLNAQARPTVQRRSFLLL